ncbi:24754_t:CDS:2, partial [Gigaspora margarita]
AFKRENPSDIYSLGVLFWELSNVESNPAIERESINSFEYKSFKNWEVIGSEEDIALSNLNVLSIYLLMVETITKVHHHINIIQFLGITNDPKIKEYYIVCQFANNGNLRNYLRKHFSELDWPTKIKMA